MFGGALTASSANSKSASNFLRFLAAAWHVTAATASTSTSDSSRRGISVSLRILRGSQGSAGGTRNEDARTHKEEWADGHDDTRTDKVGRRRCCSVLVSSFCCGSVTAEENAAVAPPTKGGGKGFARISIIFFFIDPRSYRFFGPSSINDPLFGYSPLFGNVDNRLAIINPNRCRSNIGRCSTL